MQIPIDKSLSRRFILPLGILVTVGIVVYVLNTIISHVQSSLQGADESGVKLELVTEGHFTHHISAYGSLKPQSQRSLVTQVAGTVAEIVLKPGARVESETTILRLVNPALQREYDIALLELKEAEIDHTQLEAELADEALQFASDERMQLAELKTQQAEYAAREVLARQSIISELEMNKEKSRLEQARLRHELAKERFVTFAQSKKARLNASDLRQERARKLQAMAQADLNALTINAGKRGVLQSLNESLTLGHWLSQGASVGVVADPDSLYAELWVSASDASAVAEGMAVSLDIKGYGAKGIVLRVAPNVLRNQVQVDVTLTSPLPITARPNVEVNGKILLESRDNVLLLPRPVNFEPGKPYSVYVRQSDGSFLLKPVVISTWSHLQIVIDKGLKVGDQVIVSDVSTWLPQIEIRLD
ncbi:MAG TPA: hypothetical protein DF774_01390 [Rheinheimera sp.]|nr:hypothetical protein [Rheinheimera sp.]